MLQNTNKSTNTELLLGDQTTSEDDASYRRPIILKRTLRLLDV